MNNNELFNAWLNLTKYHDRLLKAMDYKLQEQFQLGIKEFYLMYYLAHSEQKKMKLSDLVPKVSLSHSALSRLVTRLEQYRGGSLVERQTYANDKRSIDVFLLKKGEHCIHEMEMVLNDHLQSRLSDKDIQNIKRLLE
ncbi:DNA-binding MarR family transcriptional regulator [Geomicrobium halophilum]|uniref:DNA-binding MarR family transcriptional regulator n=1 Tax=Geomicrobium halophilum TaxID=549000 RepID=A0A841PVH8_9BACL|nr:MarR family transcriptional regulator [Geomicrobium halophilum]MBB6451176.1 DNA-binding MarR family transcriptional regulator [Geomicrobium halophilum]